MEDSKNVLSNTVNIVNIFDEKYKDKYLLNHSTNRIVTFLDDTFEVAMYKFIHKMYKKKDSILFINLVSHCLDNEMTLDKNGAVVRKFTAGQRFYLLRILSSGWDFRWFIPSEKNNSLKKIEKLFEVFSSQIKPEDSFYIKELKDAVLMSIKNKRQINILLEPNVWKTLAERRFISLIYKLGYYIDKNMFNDYLICNKETAICRINRKLITDTYIKLLETLVEGDCNVIQYIYYGLTEAQIRLYFKLESAEDLDLNLIKRLSKDLVDKLILCDSKDLVKYIDKELLRLEEDYCNLHQIKVSIEN